MTIPVELSQIAADLRACASELADKAIADPAKRLEAVTNEFAAAWSGSFLRLPRQHLLPRFQAATAGDHFDIETGHKDVYGQHIRPGTWTEYAIGDLEREIRKRAEIEGPEAFVRPIRRPAAATRHCRAGRYRSCIARKRRRRTTNSSKPGSGRRPKAFPRQESIAKTLGPRRRMQTADTIASQAASHRPLNARSRTGTRPLRYPGPFHPRHFTAPFDFHPTIPPLIVPLIGRRFKLKFKLHFLRHLPSLAQPFRPPFPSPLWSLSSTLFSP